MGFSRFTNDVKNISGLPDQLKNQAEYLKNKFDKGDVEQQESFNKLIDELESSTAALYLGAKKLNGEDSNVQTILTSLSRIVNTLDESVKEIINSIGENGEITNYDWMINKPKINDIELTGNKTLDDLGIQKKGDYATNEQFDEQFDELEGRINKLIVSGQYARGSDETFDGLDFGFVPNFVLISCHYSNKGNCYIYFLYPKVSSGQYLDIREGTNTGTSRPVKVNVEGTKITWMVGDGNGGFPSSITQLSSAYVYDYVAF